MARLEAKGFVAGFEIRIVELLASLRIVLQLFYGKAAVFGPVEVI